MNGKKDDVRRKNFYRFSTFQREDTTNRGREDGLSLISGRFFVMEIILKFSFALA
jgi:hypothetical protein